MKIFFAVSFLFLVISTAAQDSNANKSASNTLYGELLGSGLRVSVHYDHLFKLPLNNIYLSAGGGIAPYREGQSFAYVYFPIHGLVLYRFKNSFAELGIVWIAGRHWSGSFLHPGDYISYNLQMVTPKVGYRFESPNGGLFFETSIILLDNNQNDAAFIIADFPWSQQLEITYNGRFYPWVGISVGYTFKPQINTSN